MYELVDAVFGVCLMVGMVSVTLFVLAAGLKFLISIWKWKDF